MLKIGNVEIKNPIILAPMAGISDSAFRRIAKEFGAGLVVSFILPYKTVILILAIVVFCLGFSSRRW